MIRSRENQIVDERIGVVGLGYVGLPLAIAFADAGASVTGFDICEERIKSMLSGSSPIEDISGDVQQRHISNGQLTLTSDVRKLADVTAIVICVPTPLKPTRDPDLSMVEDAADMVRSILRTGQLVVLESTT